MVDLIAIGKVVKTRGLRGEVAADILTDFPDRLNDLKLITAVFPDGSRQELKIEDLWFQGNRMVLKFAGFDDVESAEKLRAVEICVPESEAVELSEDEFFDWELIGCKVETVDEKELGTVREIIRTGGTEILAIDGEEKEFMIPFARSICVDVDKENKLIRVDPPEGLLEF
jgi:16S rRNA processing protein RimM